MALRIFYRMFSSSETEFQRVCDRFLEVIYIKTLSEQLDLEIFEDLMHSDGVITLKIKDNCTYIINKQTPNQQIWLSSPFS